MPFVCASATRDAITARRLPHVFRLSPPQSVGWRVFADSVVTAGYPRAIIAAEASAYWSAGAAVLSAGSPVAASKSSDSRRRARRPARWPTRSRRRFPRQTVGRCSCRSWGYLEPFAALAAELGRRGLLAGRLALGDQAGRPALPDWWRHLGPARCRRPIPCLRPPGRAQPARAGAGSGLHARNRPQWAGLPSEAVPATGPQDSRSTSFVGTRTVIDCSPALDGREI
jgi:hypothetical protein